MSTHLPGFGSFLHYFVLVKLATSSIRVKVYIESLREYNSLIKIFFKGVNPYFKGVALSINQVSLIRSRVTIHHRGSQAGTSNPWQYKIYGKVPCLLEGSIFI